MSNVTELDTMEFTAMRHVLTGAIATEDEKAQAELQQLRLNGYVTTRYRTASRSCEREKAKQFQ